LEAALSGSSLSPAARAAISFPSMDSDVTRAAAEVAYAAQPLLHLAAMAYYGQDSWTPLVTSASIDILRLFSLKYIFETLNYHENNH